MKHKAYLSTLTLLIVFAGCKQAEPGSAAHIKEATKSVDDRRLVHADQNPGDWLSYGRNYYEDRYSALQQINKKNINRLGLAWSVNLGTKRGIEATPIVVDGIMYLSGPWSMVYAVDVRKGEMLWTYDPKVSGHYGEKACCDVVNRGVALYKGMVYVGTLDGRLVAIDASNGKPVWETLTVDTSKPYTITGAPRVVDGKVIIGNGGSDYGVRGYITAYDALTGKQVWRFYTVPGDPSEPFEDAAMEIAAKTWNGRWWEYGGGGTAWDAMAYDPELRLLYVGTGNGAPWNQQHRSPGGGDNLFLSSILALDPANGELKWYYQTTPGETWDYTATQHLILADLKIDGRLRKVIMQAPKNGFFYVLDRANGKLISAEPYAYINWATGVDLKTGRPVETSFSRYTNEDAVIFPHPVGAHGWQPMAYNKKTGLVYLTVRDMSSVYGHDKNWKYNQPSGFASGIGWNTATGGDPSKPPRQDKSAPKVEQERLIAWDPVKQQEVWRVPLKGFWNGGVVTTATGLVFQGTADGMFRALDAGNGKVLWEVNIGSGIIGTPMTFEVEGKQYVSIAAGWGGVLGLGSRYTEELYPGTVYTFALDASAPMPEFPKKGKMQLIDLEVSATKEDLADGETLYVQYCMACHGNVGDGPGALPDLGYSSEAVHKAFKDIVLKGLLLPAGMPDFGNRLSEKDVADIQNYILATAKEQGQKKQ
jgi:quinohemoprotein ethanol dehydrogenase